jgi:hypothetical protein
VRMILHPLGWTDPAGYIGAIDHSALERLGARLRRAHGDRILLSVEDLAEAEAAHIAAFVEMAVAGQLDVNVIVTARNWAQQLPSEWQQVLKERLTTDYETYLTHVRDRDTPEGDRFWRRQDVLGISERWSAGIGPDRVHVVVVPPAANDRNTVARLFGEVVGFDPSLIKMPAGNLNASFGYVEAEMLRRLNIALGDRLCDFKNEYLPAIRNVLIRRVIARNASARTPLPPDHVGWVRRAAEVRRDIVLDRGFCVHGDHALLVPPTDVGRPIPTVEGDEIAEAALRTLANFAIVQFEASRQQTPAPTRRNTLRSAVSVRLARLLSCLSK